MTDTNYRVRHGDTLSAIARREHVSVQDLARTNHIKDPNKIQVGQEIARPATSEGTHGTHGPHAPADGFQGTAAPHHSPHAPSDGFQSAAPHQAPHAPTTPAHTDPGHPADGFQAGRATAPNTVAPAATGQGNGYRDIDLNAFRQGGSSSESAIIVGTSEGNRTPNGGFRPSYGGHTDPGNAAHNRGSFSYQGRGASTPQQADEVWNRELGRVTPGYQQAAQRAGLNPNNALLASTFYDLHTQSPRAAQNFINRELPRLAQDPRGITRESLIDARVNAYRNDAGQMSARGFGNSEARVRADQTRREGELVHALDARGYHAGASQTRAPANPQGSAPAAQARTPAAHPQGGAPAAQARTPVAHPQGGAPAAQARTPTSSRPGSATPTNMNDTQQVAASTDRPALHANTPWYSQYDSNHVDRAGDTACFRASTAMARAAGGSVSDAGHRIQLATAEHQGGITVNRARAEQGRQHIDAELAAGRPVVVGVNHKAGHNAGNADGITDHFVVVTGRGVDAQGRTYYTFHDPATQNASKGRDTNPNNRFYVDEQTGGMYRPGNPAARYVTDRRYDVSMIR